MLRLIAKDEIKEVRIGGTVFRVRKAAHADVVRLQRENTTDGQIQREAFEDALWRHILAGWDCLAQPDGQVVEYHEDLILAIRDQLPHQVAEVLIAEGRGLELAHADEGNASTPSSLND